MENVNNALKVTSAGSFFKINVFWFVYEIDTLVKLIYSSVLLYIDP